MEEADQPDQKQNPVQTPVEPVKRNFHWIYIFIGVFTLLIISAVFYLGRLSSGQPQQISVSPTPQISKAIDETANWKTYTNSKYGYSVKYPSELLVKEEGKINTHIIDLTGFFLSKSPATQGNSMSIEVRSDAYKEIISTLQREWWGGTKESPNKAEDIEIVGTNGKRISGAHVPSGGALFEVYLPRQNLVYVIRLMVSFSEKQIGYNEKTFDNIISTFKFTSSTSAGQDQSGLTSDLKIQTIDLYKLQLSIPSNWTLQEINRRPEPTGPGNPVTGHDCAEYKITSSDNLATLSLKPICGFGDGGGDLWPKDSTIVKQIDSSNYIIRYFDSVKSVFKYVNGGDIEVMDANGKRTERMQNNILGIGKPNPVLINAEFKYTGLENKKTQYLSETDNIISSLERI